MEKNKATGVGTVRVDRGSQKKINPDLVHLSAVKRGKLLVILAKLGEYEI
jgi:hypothetical protein